MAAAIAAAARQRFGDLPPVSGFANVEGLGVSGVVDGRTVLVGRPQLLHERGLAMPEALRHTARESGQAVVAARWDGQGRALPTAPDTVQGTSAPAVAAPRRPGVAPILLAAGPAALLPAAA